MSLVCWSGGCDSTLALYDLCKKASEKKPVRAISITHTHVGAIREQAKARRSILTELRKRGYNIETAEITMSASGSFHPMHLGGVVQPVLWLTAALPYLDAAKKEDLVMGYIREDCIWHYEAHLRHAFQYLCEMLGRSECTLSLPFEWTTKAEVIRKLREAKLYKLTFSCEHPKKGQPCGTCNCCKEKRAAEWQLRTFKRDETVETT